MDNLSIELGAFMLLCNQDRPVEKCKVMLPSIKFDENEMAVVTKGYVIKTCIVNRSHALKLLDTRMMKGRCTRTPIKVCTSINQSLRNGDFNVNLTNNSNNTKCNEVVLPTTNLPTNFDIIDAYYRKLDRKLLFVKSKTQKTDVSSATSVQQKQEQINDFVQLYLKVNAVNKEDEILIDKNESSESEQHLEVVDSELFLQPLRPVQSEANEIKLDLVSDKFSATPVTSETSIDVEIHRELGVQQDIQLGATIENEFDMFAKEEDHYSKENSWIDYMNENHGDALTAHENSVRQYKLLQQTNIKKTESKLQRVCFNFIRKAQLKRKLQYHQDNLVAADVILEKLSMGFRFPYYTI